MGQAIVKSPSHPAVAAIVVGTNDGRWLNACLASLTASEFPNLLIIYVDNGSGDDSLATVRSFPSVITLLNGRNLGFAASNNIGMKYAFEHGATYVFLINPDTQTPPKLIGELVEFLETRSDYGIVGPLQAEYSISDPASLSSPNSWTRHALDNGERHVFHHWAPELASEASTIGGRAPGTLEHAYVQGSALAVRRDVIERIGYLDPAYHTFYEEVDLCRRARWAGYRVALLTGCWVQHAGAQAGKPSNYRAFHMTRNRYLYLFTDPNIRASRAIGLTFAWILDDLTQQLPSKTGLVSSLGQYLHLWLSLISHAPYVIRTRRSNRLKNQPIGA